MTEIRFYHMQTSTLDRVLPDILQKALKQNKKIIVKTPDQNTAEQLNEKLWTYNPDSFLPHGTVKDGFAEKQPVFLTDKNDNPNKADILILTGGAQSDRMDKFSLCCEMIDGQNNDMIEQARKHWKEYKEQDFDLTYWKQSAGGKWEKQDI